MPKWMMFAAAFIVGHVPSVASVHAQCATDFNRDGRVTVNEITALLSQRPSPDYLRRSIDDLFSTCPDFCRLTFRDSTSAAGYRCVYSGTAYGFNGNGVST